MSSPDATLATDTINFDRNTQEVFYNTKGTIVNKENTLVRREILSKSKEVSFLTAVTITNATYVIKSNHVDYYTNSGHSFIWSFNYY
jgi:hypothetical protein